MSNRKKKSQRQARDQWYFFGKAAFTKKQQNVTMNPHQHSLFFLFFSISELLEKSFKNTHRKHSQRADKTPTRGMFNGQRGRHEAVKAAQQQPVNRTAHREGGDASVESFFFFFLTIYPVVSLWKPGVPYPVHGRVLVEIQRPRSLHRKAVIQLNTERNQHNQSKQQVSHTVGMKVSHSSQKRKIQDLRRVCWKWDHGGKKLHVSNSSDSQKWQTRLQWCRCLWVWCWSASLTFPPLTADGRSHTRPHPGWRNRAGRSIITWGKSLHLNWTEGTGINLQWPRGAPGPAGRSISDPPPPPAWIGSAPAPPREQR